jgi:hypothetical protein
MAKAAAKPKPKNLNIFVSSFLNITQSSTIRDNHVGIIVTQSLTITQTVRQSIRNIQVNDPMVISQTLSKVAVRSYSASNALGISQSPSKTTDLGTFNRLFLNQIAAPSGNLFTHNELVITQSAVPQRSNIQTLNITQQALVNFPAREETPSQQLFITQHLTFFIFDRADIFQVDCNTLTPPVPVVYFTPDFRVEMPLPEIGDKDHIDVTRAQQLTRGGDLLVFQDLVWPKTEIITYRFIHMTRLQAYNMLQFMNDFLGQSVSMIDHRNKTWVGIITNPETPITCKHDTDCGDFEMEVQFQGIQQTFETITQPLTLSQAVVEVP